MVKHAGEERGVAPISGTCTARHGTESIISTQWNRSAVDAVRPRSANARQDQDDREHQQGPEVTEGRYPTLPLGAEESSKAPTTRDP